MVQWLRFHTSTARGTGSISGQGTKILHAAGCGQINNSFPCPWNSPGKNTGVGCHFLLQRFFPTQGLNLCLLLHRQVLYHWAIWEVPFNFATCKIAKIIASSEDTVQKGDRITSENAVRLFEVGIVIHIHFPAFSLVFALPAHLFCHSTSVGIFPK